MSALYLVRYQGHVMSCRARRYCISVETSLLALMLETIVTRGTYAEDSGCLHLQGSITATTDGGALVTGVTLNRVKNFRFWPICQLILTMERCTESWLMEMPSGPALRKLPIFRKDRSCNPTGRTAPCGHRDNLDIMRGMNSASVDLIYLDPPFNSNRPFNAIQYVLATGCQWRALSSRLSAVSVGECSRKWTSPSRPRIQGLPIVLDISGC